MLENIITITVLCAFVILVRAIFKKKVSARLVYALWLVVILKLFIPVDLISLEVPLPEMPKARAFSAFEQMGEAIGEADESIKGSAATFTESFYHASAPLQSAPVGNEDQGNAEPIPPVTAPAPSVTDDKAKEAEPLISLSGLEIILAVWAAGCGVTLLIFSSLGLRTAVRLRKSRRYHSTAGRTKVYVSPRISSPCVTGIVPAIYITPEAERCPDLHLILLHERTHIRHGDHIWAILRILCIALLWWDPLVWAAALLSKRDAELACDESVAKRMTPKERLCYTRLIIDMIPQKSAFAVAFSNGPIKYRIKRLTGKYKAQILATILTATLVIGSGGLTFVSVVAAEKIDEVVHFHDFERATCQAPELCACGEEKGEPLGHLWHEATCKTPATCVRCGETNGEPISHTWIDASCDEAKNCAACDLHEGEHLEHIYAPATCISPSTCTLCGGTEGEALGHKYYLDTCYVCGGTDPDFSSKMNAILFPDQSTALSRYLAILSLKKYGYTAVESEKILNKLNIDWKAQALKYARNYVALKENYYELNLRITMENQGFSEELTEYAVAIVITEKEPLPPMAIDDGPDIPYGFESFFPYQNNNKKTDDDDDDDDNWKYGFGNPFVWDYGYYRP